MQPQRGMGRAAEVPRKRTLRAAIATLGYEEIGFQPSSGLMSNPTLTVSPAEVTDAVPTITAPWIVLLTSKVIGPDVGSPLTSPSQAYVYEQSPPYPLT